MSERYNPSLPTPDSLKPGDVIGFADITELPAFEDMIAPLIEPDYNVSSWASRRPLRDLIRPPKFNGTIADISLTVMEEPYKQLLSAKQRGWNASTGGPQRVRISFAEEMIPLYQGYRFLAEARSTGRGTIGHIETELYYYPLYRYSDESGKMRKVLNMGDALKRIVAKPKLETEKFIELNETSRRIGFAVLQKAMSHPITSTMRG